MSISWWCTTITEPWSWTFRAYPGIWLVVGLLVFGYFWALHRNRDTEEHGKRQIAFFLAGVLVFWIASDWPLGTLGAGYLASAHMVQYILYVLVAAPLLWLGTPEWMARRVLASTGVYRKGRSLSRFPLITGVIFNVTLILTHTPIAVNIDGTSVTSASVIAGLLYKFSHPSLQSLRGRYRGRGLPPCARPYRRGRDGAPLLRAVVG